MDRIIRLGFVPINGNKVPRTTIGRRPYPPRLEVLIREDLKLGTLNETWRRSSKAWIDIFGVEVSKSDRGKRESLCSRDRWKLDIRIGVINLFDVESDELLFAFETRIFGRVRT